MPFDEEEDLEEKSNIKLGLKNISSQKSIFDTIPKKPTKDDLDKKVSSIQKNNSSYKVKAADLAMQFNKAINDKTLKENKSIFVKEMEKELLTNMAQLAIDVNNDQYEQEGMGSLSWIILLLKNSLSQRDKINQLEFLISQLEKKINLISKEIKAPIDSK